MKMSARLVAASGICIGLLVVPAAAADRDLPNVAAAQGSLAAAASADLASNATPNCLLPGQLRNIGGITMVTPRRAVTLDPADCAARGGEPIESTTASAE